MHDTTLKDDHQAVALLLMQDMMPGEIAARLEMSRQQVYWLCRDLRHAHGRKTLHGLVLKLASDQEGAA